VPAELIREILAQLSRQKISALGAVVERVVLETAILKVEAESQSQGETASEAFADSVPLHSADHKPEDLFDVVPALPAIKAPKSENGYLRWNRILLLYSVNPYGSFASTDKV
jgi:hypothetical protein